MFDLNDHTARVLVGEPFFAALSRRVEKRINKDIPTAGVRVNERGFYEMVYNPDFFETLTDREIGGVLKHEFYHLIFRHCEERLPEGGMSKIWNIATDLAINSHLIGELPENGCIPGQGHFKNYPVGLSSEQYLKMLQDDPRSQSGGGGEDGEDGDGLPDNFDDHSGWGGDKDGEDKKEQAKQRLKEALKGAAEEAAKRDWGSVSSSVRETVMEALKSRLDWRKVLRYFVKCSQNAHKKSTIKRINKRFPYIHAGRRADRVANVAISIDQSGSVSEEMLAAFYAELDKLSTLATFTVIPFDTRVEEDHVFVWKKGMTHKKERYLHGGTCFDAPTAFVNDRNFDGHLILTDLEAPKPRRSKCQRMWLTTQDCKDRMYWTTHERVIAIDD